MKSTVGAQARAASPDQLTTPATSRNPTAGDGWTQPERRKLRFRIEDVAFD